MTGEIHQVSASIGELKGQVRAIQYGLAQSDKSRKDLHDKVNALHTTVGEMSTTLSSLAGSFEGLAGTVQQHENLKQRGVGVKSLMTGALSGGLVAAVIEGLKHFSK